MSDISRKRFFAVLTLMLAGLGTAHAEGIQRQFGQAITVYKSPTCGCCTAWVDYLKTEGFRVTVHERYALDDLKTKYGIQPRLQSCHTAEVGGYVIEGHVPADDIWRLLSERPGVTGLSAPGMPQQSPGMGSIEPRGYDVLSFDADGNVGVFSRY